MFDSLFERQEEQTTTAGGGPSSFSSSYTSSPFQKKSVSVKIIVLGAKNVGKTTIGNALGNFVGFDDSGASFGGSGRSHMPQFKTTFVADVFRKELTFSCLMNAIKPTERARALFGERTEDVDLSLAFWDTAGYEAYEDLPPPMILNGASVVLLCFSLDDASSVAKLTPILEHCKRSKVSDHCVYFALGNKMDVFKELCKSSMKFIGGSKTSRERTKRSEKGREKRKLKDGIFTMDPFERSSGESIFCVLERLSGYERAKKEFFDDAGEHLNSFAMLLDEANENTNNEDGVEPLSYRKRSLLSFTTSFCNAKSVHNPLYCLLYAVAIFLKKSGTVGGSASDYDYDGASVGISPSELRPRKKTAKTTTKNSTPPHSGNGVLILNDDTNYNENTHMLGATDIKKDDCCA